jgi:CheY-like chemotaxis protein
MVEVRDTGAGIPDEVRAHIFEPFFTTKPIGVGTGLGLAICHGIVTALGGDIDLEPNGARGTIVRVVLPASSDEAGEVAAAAPALASPRRGRILIVEDEPFIARTLKRLFGEHDVAIAGDGRAALAALRAAPAPFDVILCDLMMPGMNGMDLHDELARTTPEVAERIIFLTGGAFTPRARDFLERVANPRIEKPFDPAALRALVRERMR